MIDLFNEIDDDMIPDYANSDEHKINTEVEHYKTLKGLSIILPGDVLSDPLQWWQVQ